MSAESEVHPSSTTQAVDPLDRSPTPPDSSGPRDDSGQGASASTRLNQLLAKRRTHGLSLDEADELGRLFAERDGRGYSNARTFGESAEEAGRRRTHSEEFLSSGRPMHDPLLLPPRSGNIESELDVPALLGAPEKSVRDSRRDRRPRRFQG
jgi:hypothetical protein